jgi:hypothetical protein
MRKLIFILLLCLVSLSFAQFAPEQKPVLGTQVNHGLSLSDGLVGFWLMNEGAGSVIQDLSGNGNNGTFASGAEWTAGKFGSCVNFPTGTDYINFGNKPSTKIGLDDLSGVAWVKFDTIQSSQGIFDCGARFGATEGWMFLTYNNNAIFQIRLNNGTTQSSYSSSSALTNDGLWHQAAFSIVRSGNVTFYLDGIYAGVSDVSGRVAEDLQGAQNFKISSLNSSYDILGKVDNAILFNRALSASEIAQLYREPFCMFKPSFNLFLFGGLPVSTAGGQVIFVNIN